MDKNSLSHTKWECMYHIVFAPKYSISEEMGYLKGKSSLMIFKRHANLKYKYGNRHFWCRGCYGQYILGKPANGLGNRAIYQPAAS